MALVTVEEYQERQSEIRTRIQEIDKEFAGKRFTDEVETEWDDLNDELERNAETIEQLEIRRERVQELAGEEPGERRQIRGTSRERGATFHTAAPGSVRAGDIYDLSTVRATAADPALMTREMRDRAKYSIERADFPHENANREQVQAHLERLLATSDADGIISRHMLVTGSPVYERAFGKAITGTHLTQDEARALTVGSPSGGGYAVPYTLDPTIIPTSNRAVNPLRAISRTETIAGNEWKGVTSAGITASRAPELTEASDNAPSLGQPGVRVEKVQAFVPFSIEADGDWPALQSEMARLLQDAKDDEEAASFMTGDGNSPNPQGLLTGATTTTRTTTRSTFAVADIYKIEEALGSRFRQRAQWIGNRAVYNKVRQFDTAGGANLWMRLPDGLANSNAGNTGAELIGYPANESSTMASAVRDRALLLVFGDFRYFLIVDRVGMTVELIPHIFGTANNFPTGERGIYAWWRNSSKVLSPNAFRVLEVESA